MRVKKGKMLAALALLVLVWLARLGYPQVQDRAWQLARTALDRQGSLEELIQALGRSYGRQGLVEALDWDRGEGEGPA